MVEKSCISTFYGHNFDPTQPTAEDICLEDIAHALSMLSRANGHFREFYSVGRHSLNCAYEAKARGLSVKVQLIALLHDSAKELPREALLQIFADNAIIAENAPARPAAIWHGIAAAILCATQWGVTDPEILSAIECHTTGKAHMTLLEKIIYMADATSAERDYPGVDRLRQEEMQDLDLALLHSLQQSIAFVKKKGGKLDPQTVAACEDLQERIAQKG